MSPEEIKALAVEAVVHLPGVPRDAATDRPPFQLVTLDELLGRPDPAYMVDRLIKPGDLMIVYGPAGCGKTFAIMDLIALLVKGDGDFAGEFGVNQRARVVYCTGEGRGAIGKRLLAALTKHGVTVYGDHLRIVEDVPHFMDWGKGLDGRGLDAWLDVAKEFAPDVVIFDTLVYGMAGGDENSTEDSSLALSHLSRVQKELPGVAMILIHHANKSGEFRGSTAWLGGADIIAKFRKGQDRGSGTFESEKTKDAPGFPPIEFQLMEGDDTCVVQWTGRVERERSDQEILREELVAYLKVNCAGGESAQTAAQIRDSGGFAATLATIGKALDRLAENQRSIIQRERRAIEPPPARGPRQVYHYWAGKE